MPPPNTHPNDGTVKGQDFAERLSGYGAAIVQCVEALPNTRAGRHVADQLLRSGTAPGAHYEEARGAQSRRDFVHKISLALKEARESMHWLRVVQGTGWDVPQVGPALSEGQQLVRMLSAAKRTAQGRD